MSETVELHAVFRGRVQGIGFRWTVADHAERLGLTGKAANLSDGTVEVVAQGPKERLEIFVEAIKQEPGFAKIESVSCEYRMPRTPFSGFKIVH